MPLPDRMTRLSSFDTFSAKRGTSLDPIPGIEKEVDSHWNLSRSRGGETILTDSISFFD